MRFLLFLNYRIRLPRRRPMRKLNKLQRAIAIAVVLGYATLFYFLAR